MPDVVSNGLERELRHRSSAEHQVWRRVWGSGLMYLYARLFSDTPQHLMKSSLCQSRARGARTRKNRCQIGGFRSPLLEVLDDGLSDNAGERVKRVPVPRLSFWDLQALTFPVDVIECELGDLLRTQTICSQQKKDCVVHSVRGQYDGQSPPTVGAPHPRLWTSAHRPERYSCGISTAELRSSVMIRSRKQKRRKTRRSPHRSRRLVRAIPGSAHLHNKRSQQGGR